MAHPWSVRLGRLPSIPDIRNHLYAMEAALQEVTEDVAVSWKQPRIWTPGAILDQGQTSECVGYTGRDELNGEPHAHPDLGPSGDTFYAECQAIDGYVGPHDGTTVHALAQVMRSQGLIEGYLWAFSEWTIRRWVLENGPVMVGTNWYTDMFSPDAEGIVHINDSANEGGHAYRIIGYDYHCFGKLPATQHGLYLCQNHWGMQWGCPNPAEPDGPAGFFLMSVGDMGRLIAEGGEALDTNNWDGTTPQ